MQRKGLCVLTRGGPGHIPTTDGGPHCPLVPCQDRQPLDTGHQVSSHEANVMSDTTCLSGRAETGATWPS